MWTNLERESAQARAFSEKNNEYILPARFDETEIPGLLPTIGYVNLAGTTPDELANLAIAKITSEKIEYELKTSEEPKNHLIKNLKIPLDFVLSHRATSSNDTFDFSKSDLIKFAVTFSRKDTKDRSSDINGIVDYRIASSSKNDMTLSLRTFFPKNKIKVIELLNYEQLFIDLELRPTEKFTFDINNIRHVYTYKGYLPLTLLNNLNVLSGRTESDLNLQECNFGSHYFAEYQNDTNILKICIGMTIKGIVKSLPDYYYLSYVAYSVR